MITKSGSILTAALQNNLLAIKRTQNAVDVATLRLATGLKVNSALDNPQNFFTAQSLYYRASDLSRLLDGIGQSIRTVEEAIHGTEALERLLDQAETIALDTKAELLDGVEHPDLTFVERLEFDNSPPSIQEQILASGPDAYYRLNDLAGDAIEATGNPLTFDGIYQSGASRGAPALYDNGGTFSTDFDGVDDRIAIPNSDLINVLSTPARTVELVFNADTTAGRQVLYEEGATVNGFAIYIDNGRLYVTAEDANGANQFADININAPIVAGETYHAAFVFNSADATFRGYLNGVEIGQAPVFNEDFPSHTGGIGIGRVNGGVQFHDGEDGGSGFAFNGRISDVAIYNRALFEGELFTHADAMLSSQGILYENTEFNTILEQIDRLVIDAEYRGINLLDGDSLQTFFNETNTSFLDIEGANFRIDDFGIKNINFNNLEDVDEILETIRDAREQVRNYASTLTTELNIIQVREDFTRGQINGLRAGADDLTVADQNEEGANLLALQTRQQIQFLTMGLNQVNIADFLL